MEVRLCLYRAACIHAETLRSELKLTDLKKVFPFLCNTGPTYKAAEVVASHVLRSKAAIPMVSNSLVSRTVCYMFQDECRVSLAGYPVEYCSPLCCLIRWAGPKENTLTVHLVNELRSSKGLREREATILECL